MLLGRGACDARLQLWELCGTLAKASEKETDRETWVRERYNQWLETEASLNAEHARAESAELKLRASEERWALGI